MVDSCNGIAAVLLAVIAKVSFFDCSSYAIINFSIKKIRGFSHPENGIFCTPGCRKSHDLGLSLEAVALDRVFKGNYRVYSLYVMQGQPFVEGRLISLPLCKIQQQYIKVFHDKTD